MRTNEHKALHRPCFSNREQYFTVPIRVSQGKYDGPNEWVFPVGVKRPYDVHFYVGRL